MRNRIILLSLTGALALASVPVFANKGQSHASGPKTTPPNNPHSSAATTNTTTSSSEKGNSKKTTTSTSNTQSNNTTQTTWTPTNPVAQKLSTKSTLLARAKNILPPNTDLNLATAGFKNFGQFVAAMNVSRNLNIDFGRLKAAMTGTNLAGVATGTPTSSLGQAIHRLKPGVDADAEAARAEAQAKADTQ